MANVIVAAPSGGRQEDANGLTKSAKNDVSFNDLISKKELRLLVNRFYNGNVELLDYTAQPYSDGKIGFLGAHLRLSITVLNGTKRESVSFFVKTVPYDVPSQADYVKKRGVFQQEADFYRHIVPELQCFIGEPWAANCYIVKDDIIVFEELSNKGFTMRDKIFDEELVIAGLSALARLHAASLCAEARLGKKLNSLYPKAFQERAFGRMGEARKWFNAGVEVAVEVAKEYGLNFSQIPSLCDEVYAAVRPSPTKINVVSHGDLWANNLMFNKDEPPKCVLVDFQLLRYCPVAHDVAQFLHLCTRREFRECRKGAVLKRYYDTLNAALDENGYSSRRPSWFELEQGVEEQRLSAVITAVMYFPTVLLDEDLGATIMNDTASYTQFVFHSRAVPVLENMKKDERYGQLIKEAVTELVELGERFDKLSKPS